ncbi:nickel ABC transporter, periplasmic nickel-binding protein NikA [Klebsiella variicola]|uniref:Nickel ABC transporter, periplasmic nickel-binding protein NikA n=1 Tax=Klebsiella variicola TaxID=244366 RepID=A0A7H4M987_KLEVA|nr:nickel ABC transporter, periplasmic nickel-binding protein NikA [Klebsiella variicola]
MLALNASQGPTREQAVREALNYAVDKQTLVDSVLYGTSRLPTPVCPLGPLRAAGSDAAPLRPGKSPRPAGAGWLAAAGWPALATKAGQPLAIELAFIGTDALAKSMAEIIQANLRQVGVQVTLVGEEESSIYAASAKAASV